MYIGPFEVLDRAGEVAYRLTLPPRMASLHKVFHDSIVRKYVADPCHILHHEVLDIEPKATYIEELCRF